MSEIKIHKSLHHQNIVQFGHFFEDSENVYILLEKCTNQTMNELIRKRKRLIELEIQCYLLQIVAGIKYLHQHRVIHRDLKLGNLFLTDKMEVKIADFGLATKLEFDGDRKRTVCGTPNYIAPEILEGKHGHSYEVDIWSLGVIIYTLLVGKPPFETSKVKTTYKRIKVNAYNFPEHIIISDEAKDLVIKILNLDPLRRPTLDQILIHKFLRGKKIPKLLPSSTITCPPPASFIKLYDSAPGERLQLERTEPIRSFGVQDDRTSLADVERVNALKWEKKSGALIHVKNWVDYSSKYGLGYLLSNDCLGVSFNDSTKIVLEPDEL